MKPSWSETPPMVKDLSHGQRLLPSPATDCLPLCQMSGHSAGNNETQSKFLPHCHHTPDIRAPREKMNFTLSHRYPSTSHAHSGSFSADVPHQIPKSQLLLAGCQFAEGPHTAAAAAATAGGKPHSKISAARCSIRFLYNTN